MNGILGYGEDAVTSWALKRHLPQILEELNDQSNPSDCLMFLRPSFGRRAGKGRAEFGEFDAILASLENVYLIESKWDEFSENRDKKAALTNEQLLRHKIFSWYLMKWDAQRYSSSWEKFRNTLQDDFGSKFPDRKIAPPQSLLAKNLEFVLNRLQEHCRGFSCKHRKLTRNVLLYFHGSKSAEIKTAPAEDLNFEVVNIDYSQYTSGNFIPLD
jgi:hypothetical protein